MVERKYSAEVLVWYAKKKGVLDNPDTLEEFARNLGDHEKLSGRHRQFFQDYCPSVEDMIVHVQKISDILDTLPEEIGTIKEVYDFFNPASYLIESAKRRGELNTSEGIVNLASMLESGESEEYSSLNYIDKEFLENCENINEIIAYIKVESGVSTMVPQLNVEDRTNTQQNGDEIIPPTGLQTTRPAVAVKRPLTPEELAEQARKLVRTSQRTLPPRLYTPNPIKVPSQLPGKRNSIVKKTFHQLIEENRRQEEEALREVISANEDLLNQSMTRKERKQYEQERKEYYEALKELKDMEYRSKREVREYMMRQEMSTTLINNEAEVPINADTQSSVTKPLQKIRRKRKTIAQTRDTPVIDNAQTLENNVPAGNTSTEEPNPYQQREEDDEPVAEANTPMGQSPYEITEDLPPRTPPEIRTREMVDSSLENEAQDNIPPAQYPNSNEDEEQSESRIGLTALLERDGVIQTDE